MKSNSFAPAVILALALDSSGLGAARTGVVSGTPASQERTVDEISRALSGPGVYVDASSGTPGLSALTGSVPKGLDFQTKSTPQPVWMKLDGPRAAVRTGPKPTFYFNQVEATLAGRPGAYELAVTLTVAQVMGDTRLLKWPGAFLVQSRKRIAQPDLTQAIECKVEKMAEGLYRLTPVSPLQPGEFAFLPGRALAEVSVSLAMDTRYRPQTPVYAFGVDAP